MTRRESEKIWNWRWLCRCRSNSWRPRPSCIRPRRPRSRLPPLPRSPRTWRGSARRCSGNGGSRPPWPPGGPTRRLPPTARTRPTHSPSHRTCTPSRCTRPHSHRIRICSRRTRNWHGWLSHLASRCTCRSARRRRRHSRRSSGSARARLTSCRRRRRSTATPRRLRPTGWGRRAVRRSRPCTGACRSYRGRPRQPCPTSTASPPPEPSRKPHLRPGHSARPACRPTRACSPPGKASVACLTIPPRPSPPTLGPTSRVAT
mmetsp:Transcript_30232/g.97599  ORF Transcript_30232/g.97599 Transcript_30232/m.97599 type:complete len:260 (+) Transcript_30232:258-1037(+)